MRVDFYLYFPTREASESAADALRNEGYEVVTRLGADEVNWLALARRDVSEGALDSAEARMEELAAAHGGEYDGLECAVDAG